MKKGCFQKALVKINRIYLSDKMKIRILIDARSPGGIETHVMNLCEGLARHHDCMIVFVRYYPSSSLYTMCQSRGISYKTFLSYKELFNFFWNDKPDIIHTHGYKANIVGRLIGLVSRAKVVSTFHSGEKPAGRLILYNWLDRWTSFFSRNIAVNSAIADSIPARTQVIPNFVDIPAIPNCIKLSSPYNVYFIGRVNPEKGPLNFCQLSTFNSEGINWHMVGSGPLLETCQEKYGETVRFHGSVTNMGSVWPDVDMLCITSLYEGLPLVLLEAMSRGIPVVSFDVGSVGDVLDDKEYIIDKFDILEMNTRIKMHFKKSAESRFAMSQRARSIITNNLSSAVILPRLLALYDECLE